MKFARLGVGAVIAALTVAGAAAFAAPAAADYGSGAAYEIELSDNLAGPQGGGVWLWIELNGSGGGDYRGADCGHGVGAARDSGDVTWSRSPDNTKVIIHGVVLNGLGGYAATVTVPATFGHYSGTDETFITLPPFIPAGIGNTQLQVAP